MMKRLNPLIAILGAIWLLACCSCAATSLLTRRRINEIEYNSSVRLMVTCTEGTKVLGSGVAISSRHVLTASHVIAACGDAGPWQIDAWGPGLDGPVELTTDANDVDSDIARLVVVGTSEPFTVFAKTSARRPETGETVCLIAGDSPEIHSIRKCADVAYVDEDGGYIIVGIHVVPGNSGGPLFDSQGNVIALVSKGRWREGTDYIGLFVGLYLNPKMAEVQAMMEQP